MALDLQSDTGSVLKPTINAAKRTLDTGRVEITDTTLTIKGNGPANVAAIDLELDLPSTFDSITVEPGEYDWDFSQLWDVFREGRKSNSYRLYYEDPLAIADWETIDDLPGISRGEREVLEANGITTPRQLKDASTDDITGKTEYTYENYRGEEESTEAEVKEPYVSNLK